FATQTTLAALLAKVIAAPATEAKQDTLIAKDYATQTTLAGILSKLISSPATEAKQDALISAISGLASPAQERVIESYYASAPTIPTATRLDLSITIDGGFKGTYLEIF